MVKKYRNEWKYRCSSSDLAMIGSRLAAILERDANSAANGKYEIHSLYFDDLYNTCMQENDAGISQRSKYRIRYYGGKPDFLRLERKEKRDSRCHKESCLLSLEDYDKIIHGNADELFWQTQDPLLRRFCMLILAKGFAPKAIIDYERTAYIEEISNIRITLDENISVSDDLVHFLDGNYLRYPLQENSEHVLEVKFDDILPSHVRHVITNRDLVQSSFSKYYLGRKKLQNMGRVLL